MVLLTLLAATTKLNLMTCQGKPLERDKFNYSSVGDELPHVIMKAS